MMDPVKEFVITSVEEGSRIDKVLADQYPEFSRSYFQALIEKEAILLNGKPIKKQVKTSLGDSVRVTFQEPPVLDVTPESIPLDILYEDPYLIAINKPPGMVVHPAPGHYGGTFANALTFHCKEIEIDPKAPFRPGIVHRLDKDTTGVLIAAKTLLTHQKLVEQFSSRSVQKTYLAICVGKPPEGGYSAPIGRHPVKRKEMAVIPGGKEAISLIKPLAWKTPLSLTEVRLITGRTHQIRVHMRHLGCPVLGDPVYGAPAMNKKFSVERQMLHASRIQFLHPFSGIPLDITAPLPYDMKKLIDLI